jgi:tRNA 2-selenouridine synthase SelU
MDVPAAIEFDKGAFNHAINYPLINDQPLAYVTKKMDKQRPSL